MTTVLLSYSDDTGCVQVEASDLGSTFATGVPIDPADTQGALLIEGTDVTAPGGASWDVVDGFGCAVFDQADTTIRQRARYGGLSLPQVRVDCWFRLDRPPLAGTVDLVRTAPAYATVEVLFDGTIRLNGEPAATSVGNYADGRWHRLTLLVFISGNPAPRIELWDDPLSDGPPDETFARSDVSSPNPITQVQLGVTTDTAAVGNVVQVREVTITDGNTPLLDGDLSGLVTGTVPSAQADVEVSTVGPDGPWTQARGMPVPTSGDGLATPVLVCDGWTYNRPLWVRVTPLDVDGDPVAPPGVGSIVPPLDGDGVAAGLAGCEPVWITFPGTPTLNAPAAVAGPVADVTREPRAGLFDVVGAELPVAVTDTMRSRAWSFVIVATSPGDADGWEQRLATGRVFYVHTLPDHPVIPDDGWYLAATGFVRSTGVTRWPNGADPSCPTDVLEVGVEVREVRPPSDLVVGSYSSWGCVVDAVDTWGDVVATYPSWGDVQLALLCEAVPA